jgi:hypothetical protein
VLIYIREAVPDEARWVGCIGSCTGGEDDVAAFLTSRGAISKPGALVAFWRVQFNQHRGPPSRHFVRC